MGYALLWIVTAVGELVLVATLLACIAHVRRSWLRISLSVLVVLVALGSYLALNYATVWVRKALWASDEWGAPGRLLALVCSVGAIWILYRALRRVGEEPRVPAASRWPRGKLAATLAIIFALYLMTFWNLDAAARQRIEALRVEAGALALSVASAKIPDRDNAAVIYQQAFQAMGDEPWAPEWRDWLGPDRDQFDLQDARLRRYVADRAAARGLLHRAAQKPGCYFDHDFARPSVSILLPELKHLRDSARLLVANARIQAADGEISAALEDVNALFAMAEHAGSDHLLISMLVSARLEWWATWCLQDVLARSQPSAEQLALVNVSDTLSYARALTRGIRMEEAMGLSAYYEFGAELRVNELTGDDEWIPSAIAPLYRVFLLDHDVASYREIMGRYHSLALKPFHERADDEEEFFRDLQDAEYGLLARALVPAMERVGLSAAVADARQQLARTALACARHRAAHGKLPQSPEELVPEFLPLVPRDPFDGKPLKWTATDERLVLYSVGPDRQDDGGKPVDANRQSDESLGDIVFTLPK